MHIQIHENVYIVYVCLYVQIHMYEYLSIYVSIYTYMYINGYVNIFNIQMNQHLFVCVYNYLHLKYIHKQICLYVLYVYVNTCKYLFVDTSSHIYMYVYVSRFTSISRYLLHIVYINVYMYLHICLYIYIHEDMHINKYVSTCRQRLFSR